MVSFKNQRHLEVKLRYSTKDKLTWNALTYMTYTSTCLNHSVSKKPRGQEIFLAFLSLEMKSKPNRIGNNYLIHVTLF